MKVLIIEDNIERQEKFKKLFQNQQVYIFDNIIDAFEACKSIEFNIACLDHDLDHRVWVDSNEENTGYNFLRLILNYNNQTNKTILKRSLIYIHSMNVVGANRMLNLLKDEGYDGIWYPFYLWKF